MDRFKWCLLGSLAQIRLRHVREPDLLEKRRALLSEPTIRRGRLDQCRESHDAVIPVARLGIEGWHVRCIDRSEFRRERMGDPDVGNAPASEAVASGVGRIGAQRDESAIGHVGHESYGEIRERKALDSRASR